MAHSPIVVAAKSCADHIFLRFRFQGFLGARILLLAGLAEFNLSNRDAKLGVIERRAFKAYSIICEPPEESGYHAAIAFKENTATKTLLEITPK